MADIFGRMDDKPEGELPKCTTCERELNGEFPAHMCFSCDKLFCRSCLTFIGRVTLVPNSKVTFSYHACSHCYDGIDLRNECPDCKHSLLTHNHKHVCYDAPEIADPNRPRACTHEFTLFTSVEYCHCNGRKAAMLIEMGY